MSTHPPLRVPLQRRGIFDDEGWVYGNEEDAACEIIQNSEFRMKKFERKGFLFSIP